MIRNIRSFFSRLCPNGVITLFLTVFLVLGIAGCSFSHPKKTDTLRIGVALYSMDDTFISSVKQNLEQLAQKIEVEQGRKINLSFADGTSNQTTQMEQIDRFLAKGCDVLCVNIVDRTAAAVLIDKVESAGIPLIFFNRQPVAEDIDYRNRVYYVGSNAQESGIMQGQLVVEAWRKDPSQLDYNRDGILQYVMLEGEPGHQDSLLRTEYSVKALTNAGIVVEKLAGDAANWNRGQAAARMQQWIAEFGDKIEVVFSNNDDMALGAIDAWQEQEGHLPLIVGIDATAPALEAVAAGTLYGTVFNDSQGMARVMLDLALALSSGTDTALKVQDGHYVWLPHQKITQANLEEFYQEME